MRRFLFLSHRYLGIAVGLVMLLWCLSGFVMIYVPYPSLSQTEVLRGSAPLDLGECCETEAIADLKLVDVYGFRVEMLGERPVLRVRASGGRNPVVLLDSGELLRGISPDLAGAVAQGFQREAGIGATLSEPELVRRDQWTVTRAYDPYRPMYRFRADDEAGTEWYVAGTNGEVVQLTTAGQRFWNWLGAVPHWLYPTVLRQYDQLWSQVVIWLSLAGSFLAAIGLYIGITQFRTRRSGRKSPYRGLALWHHYAGLGFGLFLLTWVVSGFFSMNPWGMFDFSGGAEIRQRLAGLPLYADEMTEFLERLPAADLPPDTVRLEAYPVGGRLYVAAWNAAGKVQRLDGRDLQPDRPNEAEWQAISARVAGPAPVIEAGWLAEEDNYYYTGHDLSAEFPVFRILLEDEGASRIYLHPETGRMVAYFDRSQKWYRWLFQGLHRLDLTASLRSRPLSDLLLWSLMLGVTLATFTGTWMGLRRLRGRR